MSKQNSPRTSEESETPEDIPSTQSCETDIESKFREARDQFFWLKWESQWQKPPEPFHLHIPLACLPHAREMGGNDESPLYKTARHLIHLARQKKTCTYTELRDFAKLHNMPGLFCTYLSDYLDQINDISNFKAGVLLSVLVVGDNGMPAKPFFDKAVDQWNRDLDSLSHKDFFDDECNLVYQAAQMGELHFFSIGSFDNPNKVRYKMGNISDLLKHGMMAEFVRWWHNQNKDKTKFVFLDPFCGLPYRCYEKGKENKHLTKLRSKDDLAILDAQPDTDKYYGSTHAVLNQTPNDFLSVVFASDASPEKVDKLLKSDKRERIKKIDCKDFKPENGYSILYSINSGNIPADMVLIDPYCDMEEMIDYAPYITLASQKTTVILFALIDDDTKWNHIWEKLPSNSIVLTYPSMSADRETKKKVRKSKYRIKVILASHLLAGAEASELRKKLKCYAATLSSIVGETITCE